MGLDTTHGCWNGGYHSFMAWRKNLARVAGLPPLSLMEGFFRKGDYLDPFVFLHNEWPSLANEFYDSLPIKWDSLKEDPYFHELLHHSDCDGDIKWESCGPMSGRLKELLPLMGDWQEKTEKFINGLMEAFERKESVEFH